MRVRVERMGLSRFEPCGGRNVLIGMKVTGQIDAFSQLARIRRVRYFRSSRFIREASPPLHSSTRNSPALFASPYLDRNDCLVSPARLGAIWGGASLPPHPGPSLSAGSWSKGSSITRPSRPGQPPCPSKSLALDGLLLGGLYTDAGDEAPEDDSDEEGKGGGANVPGDRTRPPRAYPRPPTGEFGRTARGGTGTSVPVPASPDPIPASPTPVPPARVAPSPLTSP